MRWLVATSESLACFAASRLDTQKAVRGKLCLQSTAAVAGLFVHIAAGATGWAAARLAHQLDPLTVKLRGGSCPVE